MQIMENRVLDWKTKRIPKVELLVTNIASSARNLFQTRQLMCTEAVLVALNHGLGGGLSDDQAVAMAAPFCEALGDSGCLCGALSGAVMGCGLLLGKDHPYRHRKEIRDCARQLHDSLKSTHGSTCCRLLSQKVKHDKRAHFRQCTDLTEEATELATRLILRKRPELLKRVNNNFLRKRQSKIEVAISRLSHLFSH